MKYKGTDYFLRKDRWRVQQFSLKQHGMERLLRRVKRAYAHESFSIEERTLNMKFSHRESNKIKFYLI